jgi:hypothetical protein
MRFLPVLGLALLGCSAPPPEEVPLQSTQLAGLVDGTPWTLSAAAVNPATSTDLVFATTFATGVVERPCDLTFTPPVVLGRLPTTAGEVPISDAHTVVFSVPAGGNSTSLLNRIATEGRIRIDEVDLDANVLVGAVYAFFDDDHEINGAFTAELCPEDPGEL